MAGPVVVKAGGTTLEDPATAASVVSAVVAWSRRPGGVVFVHGGGRAVDRQLERLGMTSERREGIRITPAEMVEEIAGVLAGSFNKRVVSMVERAGGRSVGLCLGDWGVARTRKTRKYAFDAGRVGEVVDGGKGEVLRLLVGAGVVPVVASVGIDEADGGFLNVNADDAASGVARAVGAEALVLVTDVPGIMDGAGAVVAEVRLGERGVRDAGESRTIEGMIAGGEITGGMIVKARAAGEAARAAGTPVVIVSGKDVEALSGGERVGTRVVA